MSVRYTATWYDVMQAHHSLSRYSACNATPPPTPTCLHLEHSCTGPPCLPFRTGPAGIEQGGAGGNS